MGQRRHRRLSGRYLVMLGALALLIWASYELWIRLEDFWAWTSGVRHLSQVRGDPFIENMAILFEDPAMRALGYKLLFLICAILFSIICLIRRSRARGGWLIILMAIAVAAFGQILGLYSLSPTDWAQDLKVLPLLLICAGIVVNFIHRSILRKRPGHRHSERHMPEPPPPPPRRRERP